MAELVDALDLGSSEATLGGSSPSTRTRIKRASYNVIREKNSMVSKSKTLSISYKISDNKEFSINVEIEKIESKKLETKVIFAVKSVDFDAIIGAIAAERAKSFSLPGFRVGKVPLHMVIARMKDELRGQIQQDLVTESFDKIAKEHEFSIAGSPNLVSEEITDKDINVTVTFESLPKIEMPDFSKIKLTKYVVSPEELEKEAEARLQKVSSFHKDKEPCEKSTKAKAGDIVTLKFIGKIDGVAFAGGSSDEHDLEIGSGNFIDNFETQLIGLKQGDTKIVKVTFPKEYHNHEYAGKDAEFDVEVLSVNKVITKPVDDELAKKLGYESAAKLKEYFLTTAESSGNEVSELLLKKGLFDELDKLVDVDLPQSLLEQEKKDIHHNFEHNHNHETGECVLSEEENKQMEDIAKRRVKMALFVSSFAKESGVTFTNEEAVQQLNLILSAIYDNKQREQAINFYTKTQQGRHALFNATLEKNAVAKILESCEITNENITHADLIEMTGA